MVVSTPSPETLPDDVPEADWAEQVLDADPLAGEGGQPGSRLDVGPGRAEANEADLAEQGVLAYGESDESRD